jgi:hypothetical protein
MPGRGGRRGGQADEWSLESEDGEEADDDFEFEKDEDGAETVFPERVDHFSVAIPTEYMEPLDPLFCTFFERRDEEAYELHAGQVSSAPRQTDVKQTTKPEYSANFVHMGAGLQHPCQHAPPCAL